jgi:hypothetical protein
LQIRLNDPKETADKRGVEVSVSWSHPQGYEDADIYGYDAPSAYPIRCQVPEDRLQQPRVEAVPGGGRMSLTLPIDVLQERYGKWVDYKIIVVFYDFHCKFTKNVIILLFFIFIQYFFPNI